MLLGDFFDVHAALGAGHDERAGSFTIQENGEIKFFFDLRTGGEQQRLHHAALGTGLLGDECLTKHLFGETYRFVHGRRDFHAALEAGFESALAASAGMDLRFDNDARTASGDYLICRRAHFGERLGREFERDGDAVFGEQLLGLVFVNVHVGKNGRH